MDGGLDPTTYLYPADEDYQDFLLGLGIEPGNRVSNEDDEFEDDEDEDDFDDDWEDEDEEEGTMHLTLGEIAGGILGALGPNFEDVLDDAFGE